MTKLVKKVAKKKVKKLDVEQEKDEAIAKMRRWRDEAVNSLSFPTALFWGEKLICIADKNMNNPRYKLLTRDDPLDIYSLAVIQYHNSNWLEGLQLTKRIPKSKRKSLLKCQLLSKLEKWEEILEELESPVSSDFDGLLQMTEISVDSLLWQIKGAALQNKASKELAKQCFVKALNIDPHCYQAFDSLLDSYLISTVEGEQIIHDLPLDKYTGTEADIIQSLYISKLSKYCKKEIFGDAIETIRKAGLSKCILASLSKAEVYMANYDFKPAYDILEEALEPNKYNVDLLVPYIICLSQISKINVLFVLVHELVDLFPKSCVTWFGVGVYYYHIGKFIEARRYFSKTVQMNPHFGPGWIAFGHSFSLEGEYDSAISTYSSASKVLLGVHLPLLYIGMEHVQLENYALAQDFYNLAFEKCQSDPLLLNEMGVLEYANEHNYEEARRNFLLVTCETTALESAYIGLGLVAYFESNLQEAVEWISKALSINTSSKYCQDILDEIINEIVHDAEKPLSILPDSIWAIDVEQLKQKAKDDEMDIENLDDSDILSNPDEILFEYNISSKSDPFVDSSPPRTRKSPRTKKGVNVSPPGTGPRRGLLNFQPEQKTLPRKLRSRISNPFEPSYSDDLSIPEEPEVNIFGITETPDMDIDMDLDDGYSSDCIKDENRTLGLHSLKAIIVQLAIEEQEVFLISQTSRNCDIQRFLFEIIKQPKSPLIKGLSQDVISSLNLIQGMALLHYPSKKLVALNQRMNILLSFVATVDQQVLVNVLETLQAVLVDSVENKRIFENNGGLELICSTLTAWKSESVNHKCIELFAVYLQQEANLPDSQNSLIKSVEEKKKVLSSLVGTKFVEKLLVLFQ
ncbi:anaphase promoting complex subunit cdc16 [Terramyces sp. JEL0728]|nr:anaphase promoting complex subunit cdc16 [Terramyces sp. JEL0728]